MPFRFFFNEAVNSLVRNWVMSIAAIVTVLVSMFILGVGTFIFINLQTATKAVKGKLEIELFIDSSASPEEIDRLGEQIDAMPEVRELRFISKDDAMEIMRERLKGSEEMLEAVSGNPLPASYQIVLKEPEKIEAVASSLYGDPIVDKTVRSTLADEMDSSDNYMVVSQGEGIKFDQKTYLRIDEEILRVSGDPQGDRVPVMRGQSGTETAPHTASATIYKVDGIKTGGETTERVLVATKYLLAGGSGFVALLAVASVLLISNTIRLSIFARRREVEIMRLVGATNSFIRWPFIIEGMTTGMLGATGALGLVLLVEYFFVKNVVTQMPFLGAETVPLLWLVGLIVGGGILLGSIGSSLALRRFLRI
ncbi:MAG: ABC transporter permease [Thermoleophilia bacterium]|nr:ABC transporter permease [Thermoleophilia bacterium]